MPSTTPFEQPPAPRNWKGLAILAVSVAAVLLVAIIILAAVALSASTAPAAAPTTVTNTVVRTETVTTTSVRTRTETATRTAEPTTTTAPTTGAFPQPPYPAPNGSEWARFGPFTSSTECTEASTGWPSATSQCFAVADQWYWYGLRQAS